MTGFEITLTGDDVAFNSGEVMSTIEVEIAGEEVTFTRPNDVWTVAEVTVTDSEEMGSGSEVLFTGVKVSLSDVEVL